MSPDVAAGDPAQALAAELRERIEAAGAPMPEVALVLGSGLGAFADSVEGAAPIPFDELPSMARSTVPGHAGRFVAGTVGGRPIICSQGRVHLYEGHPAEVVTRSVRAFGALGVRTAVLTNAAGGMVQGWPVPCLMAIEDHVNMQGQTPLRAGQARVGRPYSDRALEALKGAATAIGLDLRTGVYVGLPGPTYETAAEIRMLRAIDAHAVGMSTVLEAVAANAAGMEVAAISCITNPAAGISAGPLDHDEVVEAGQAIADDFARLLREAVPRLG